MRRPVRDFLRILFLALLPLAAHADILIAQVAPFSGPLAPTGRYLNAGAQLYFDAVNASGGVLGKKIRLVTKDDSYKAEETVRLAREFLKESQPLAFFGFVGTGNVEALLKEKVLENADIPLITVRSGASSIAANSHPLIFLTRASYAEEVDKIIQQYGKTGFTRFAVFYQNDAFGQDVLISAEAAIRKAGVSLVAKASYEKNTTQVEAAVSTIAKASPQAVLMISNTAASAAFLKQSRDAGNLSQFVTLSTSDGEQIVRLIGADKAQGLVLTQIVPDPKVWFVPINKEIEANFRKFAPKDVSVNQTFAEGYLGAKILCEALRRAGPNATRKKLQEALDNLRNYDAGGITISFAPGQHAGSHFVDISILNRDGKLLH